ncbi:hypothetical protein ABNM52_09685 [Pseudomonas syringae]
MTVRLIEEIDQLHPKPRPKKTGAEDEKGRRFGVGYDVEKSKWPAKQ